MWTLEGDKSGEGHHGRGLVLMRWISLWTALVGLVLSVTAVADFFASFGRAEQPLYTRWLWAGLPMLIGGLVLCHWAYRGVKLGPRKIPTAVTETVVKKKKVAIKRNPVRETAAPAVRR